MIDDNGADIEVRFEEFMNCVEGVAIEECGEMRRIEFLEPINDQVFKRAITNGLENYSIEGRPKGFPQTRIERAKIIGQLDICYFGKTDSLQWFQSLKIIAVCITIFLLNVSNLS